MRSIVDSDAIRKLMKTIGTSAKGPGRVYFTGGASALLIGWRHTTVDIDLSLEPEPLGIFEAIQHIKSDLNINIELASPKDFLPALPNWEGRSTFIERYGKVDFFHYDFTAQALSKISRGHNRDLSDVQAMFERGLFSIEELNRCFKAIEPQLIRYPSIDASALKVRVQEIQKKLVEEQSGE